MDPRQNKTPASEVSGSAVTERNLRFVENLWQRCCVRSAFQVSGDSARFRFGPEASGTCISFAALVEASLAGSMIDSSQGSGTGKLASHVWIKQPPIYQIQSTEIDNISGLTRIISGAQCTKYSPHKPSIFLAFQTNIWRPTHQTRSTNPSIFWAVKDNFGRTMNKQSPQKPSVFLGFPG